ncbi:MAG: carbohydrate-binding family 9-like protein [Acidobacteria bacterium]|nr:carbohydrate-binding family 9-like protein [Acidobacteriota bacterium]
MKIAISFLTLLLVSVSFCFSQTKMNYRINYTKEDFPVAELENKAWDRAAAVTVDKYWSGEAAPKGRQFKAKLLWSETALYVRFEANQKEPLIVADKPNLASKTRGLWDRDVCEIFLAPNREHFREYFEFEIAPTGEWIDLGIHQMPDKRDTDWDYASGMTSKSIVGKNKVWMAIRIEWKAFGKTPKAGEIWPGNIFRCIGKDPTRGYLAWSPTLTKEPSFHVPEKFGEFEFVK